MDPKEFTAVHAERQEVQQAIETEHDLSTWQALKAYKKAVFWSFIVSMSTVMESYDMQLIGSFYAYPSFQRKFGEQLPNGTYSIPAQWQVALSLSASVGVVIGIIFNGFLVDHFGHKRLLLVSFVLLTGFIFITFFAPNVQILFAGEILCGLPWGVYSVIAPAYAVEVAPMVLRSYLTTYVNLTFVIGHLIAAGILDGLVNVTTEWSYKIPFAVQWAWPLPLFLILLFAPDSPWWLVRRNRLADAENALRRLSSPETTEAAWDEKVKQSLAMIVYTNQLEQEMQVQGSFLDCFKRTDLRRTEIACVVWATQVLVGFAIQSYTTYFFTLAGLAASDAYKLALGTYSIAFVGTVLSWFMQAYLGRRTIFISGLIFLTTLMWIVGFLSLTSNMTTQIEWAQSILLMIWFGGYGLTIGPLPYVIASEISATRLRNKTIALARNTFCILQILNAVVAPYMLNPAKGNLKGKAAFLPAALSLVCLLWTYFRLPETKGRTFAELDVLFERKTPARQFKSSVTTTFEDVELKDSKKTTV